MDIKAKCESKGLRWVGGEGNPHASMMLVGEALGAEEERLGLPFVGGAGQLLNGVLRQIGLPRTELYITNVVKVRPPKNDLKLLSQLGLSSSEFLPWLKLEIESIKPNVIVALGGHALQALTSLPSIMAWRGSTVESTLVPGVKVIPAIHPAAILRNYKWRPLLVFDLTKVKREASTPTITLPKRHLFIEPDFNTVSSVIREMITNSREEKVACDIEVDKMGMLSCIGFSPSPDWALCIPMRNGYASYWSEGEEYQIWLMIKELFHSDKKFIFQNALFDLKWLVPRVGYFTVYMDTMWAHQTIYAEIPKGLDMLASIYTNEPYYKDERKVWKDTSITRQLWSYNAKDAAITREVADKLEEELKGHKLEQFFFGFVMKLLPVLLKTQERGLKVDTVRKEEIKKVLQSKADSIQLDLKGLNVRSSKQMKALLYDEMKLPKMYHYKKGNLTTSKDALIKLRQKVR